MHVFSNGFPTNLPDSEHISQGGPANFARLFFQYLETTEVPHRWTGIMLDSVQGGSTRINLTCELEHRAYYTLSMPKSRLRSVVQARSGKVQAERMWAKPIALLAKLMRQEKPDVVFLNGFGVLNWMLLRAAKEAGIPVVIQHAGIWTKELGIHKDRYSEHGRMLLERMEQESSELSSIEVFLNGWSRDYYRQHVAVGSPRRTEIVPLPFDFGSFKELSGGATGRFAFDPSRRHIGIIARWDDIKNHPAVLAMAKEARRRKLPWQFHSVVEIPDSKEYAEKKAAYRRYVDIVAPQDRAGISDFCRSVDLLILPSLFDVSPTVVLEAISLGTPIAISPTVGHVENFRAHGGTEWVIDPVDASAAVAGIEAVMGRPMPQKLAEHITAAHDHKKVFEEYLRLFAEARLRDMPMREVIKTLFWQELGRYLPWLGSSRERA